MVSSSKGCREIQDNMNWKMTSGKLSWPTGDSGEVGRWYHEACYFPLVLLSRTLSNREIPPGKSFAEIRSKRSAFPKVKLCHCRLESQSLVGSLWPVSMPAPAILGDHTGKMTLYLEGFLACLVVSFSAESTGWLPSLCTGQVLWGLGGWYATNGSIINNK